MNPSLSDLSVRVRGFCRNTVPPSTITLEYEHPTLGSNEFATLRYSPTFSVGEALALGSATPDDDERDIVDGINLLMEAAVFAIEGHYLRKSPSADYLGKRHEFWRQVIHTALDEVSPDHAALMWDLVPSADWRELRSSFPKVTDLSLSNQTPSVYECNSWLMEQFQEACMW